MGPRLRGDDALIVCAASFALALLSCLVAIEASAAPLPSQLGPEVAMTRPRDGYVGRLNVTPENGPAGTTVTVTADQLPPNQELAAGLAHREGKLEGRRPRISRPRLQAGRL